MKLRRKRIDPNTIVLLKHIGVGILVLTVTALIVTGIWYGTRVQALTITDIQVKGGETIEHSEVESTLKAVLEGTYLGLVPRKFAWFYPELDMRASLDGIDRMHNLTIERVGGTELVVSFDEYVPEALWCMSATSDECLFLDETGYAFGKAPVLSGSSFLRFSKTEQPTKLHTLVTATDSFTALRSLTELLAERSWFISNIEVDQVGDAFLQVAGGGELKVTLSQTPAETVENLFVVLGSETFAHIAPGNFQYIDLRYGNKVFVNEEIAAPEEEAAIKEDVVSIPGPGEL